MVAGRRDGGEELGFEENESVEEDDGGLNLWRERERDPSYFLNY